MEASSIPRSFLTLAIIERLLDFLFHVEHLTSLNPREIHFLRVGYWPMFRDIPCLPSSIQKPMMLLC